MTTKRIIAAAAIAAVAGFAANANPGADQLAAQAGVEPGAYSLSDLVRLLDEKNESGRGNDNRTAFILENGGNSVSRAAGSAALNPGEVQLARQLGVEPGAYSLAELTRLIAEEGESGKGTDLRSRTILNDGVAGVSRAGSNRGISAGEAQLAASAGVEPGTVGLAELVRLTDEKNESGRGNDNRRAFILSGS